MGLIEAFKFRVGNYGSQQFGIDSVYRLGIDADAFIKADVKGIFLKILTDCVERTQGIPEEHEHVIWDNCLESESKKGLLSLLSEAMACKSELYLVYKENVLRLATNEEQVQIKADYLLKATSSVGTFISFRNYDRTELLTIFSSMEYQVLSSLNKTMNLSKALQFKMANMRESVGAIDSSDVINQAKSMALALGKGNDVLMDGEDIIETSTPNMDPTEKAIYFLDAKRSFILNMPLSYITGEQTTGIGSTGEADTKAVERGLRQYWISIIKPVIKALFNSDVTFRSQDFRQITSALEAIKTFELVGEKIISLENQRLIVSTLLDIDNDLKGEPNPDEELNDDNSEPEKDIGQDSPEEKDKKVSNPKTYGK